MGTVVELSTLRAMILEILSKNTSLKKDIFDAIVNENPRLIEEYTSINNPTLVNESFVDSNTENEEVLLEKTELSDSEIRILAKQQFAKYDTVFKALA